MNKVRNGTRSDQVHLCQTCRRGTIIKGAAESQEQTHCGEINKFIRYRVNDCTQYSDRSVPSVHDMADTAWILSTKKTGRDIGFMKASDFRKEFKEDILPSGID